MNYIKANVEKLWKCLSQFNWLSAKFKDWKVNSNELSISYKTDGFLLGIDDRDVEASNSSLLSWIYIAL